MPDSTISGKVLGLDDLAHAIDELSSDLRLKVVYGALRDAARPLVQAARDAAPVLANQTTRRVPGTLRSNIKAFASKQFKGQNGTLGVYVTVKASRKDLKRSPVSGDPYYFRWVEGGHKIVARSRKVGLLNGRARYEKTLRARRESAAGFVSARPFLQPAFDERGAEAVRIFQERIIARIAKANSRT